MAETPVSSFGADSAETHRGRPGPARLNLIMQRALATGTASAPDSGPPRSLPETTGASDGRLRLPSWSGRPAPPNRRDRTVRVRIAPCGKSLDPGRADGGTAAAAGQRRLHGDRCRGPRRATQGGEWKAPGPGAGAAVMSPGPGPGAGAPVLMNSVWLAMGGGNHHQGMGEGEGGGQPAAPLVSGTEYGGSAPARPAAEASRCGHEHAATRTRQLPSPP
jgi:hypothetical protein